MDENLIPSASTGEPRAFYSEKKDDYYRSLAERATGDARSKAVDVPMVSERKAPMIQKVLKTVEVPQMQYSDRIVDSPVVTQCRVSTIQLVHKTVDMPQVQFLDRVLNAPVSTQRHMPQKQILECIVEETDIPVPHVMEKTIDQKCMKLGLHEDTPRTIPRLLNC